MMNYPTPTEIGALSSVGPRADGEHLPTCLVVARKREEFTRHLARHLIWGEGPARCTCNEETQ